MQRYVGGNANPIVFSNLGQNKRGYCITVRLLCFTSRQKKLCIKRNATSNRANNSIHTVLAFVRIMMTYFLFALSRNCPGAFTYQVQTIPAITGNFSLLRFKKFGQRRGNFKVISFIFSLSRISVSRKEALTRNINPFTALCNHLTTTWWSWLVTLGGARTANARPREQSSRSQAAKSCVRVAKWVSLFGCSFRVCLRHLDSDILWLELLDHSYLRIFPSFCFSFLCYFESVKRGKCCAPC